MNNDISDNQHLQTLVGEGVVRLSGDQLQELSTQLEARAVETGLAAPLFVSQTVRAIAGLLVEHDSAGGVRMGFLRQLDDVIRTHVPEIQQGDPLLATARARQLRDEVQRSIRHYDPRNTYE